MPKTSELLKNNILDHYPTYVNERVGTFHRTIYRSLIPAQTCTLTGCVDHGLGCFLLFLSCSSIFRNSPNWMLDSSLQITSSKLSFKLAWARVIFACFDFLLVGDKLNLDKPIPIGTNYTELSLMIHKHHEQQAWLEVVLWWFQFLM